MTQVPLVLIPGMGADARLFLPQQAAFPQLKVATWITPDRHESLPEYAGRMASAHGVAPGSVLGGASFGGVVALEMACLIRPQACLLIGSLRSPLGLRPGYRLLGPVSGLVGFAPRVARWVRNWRGIGYSAAMASVVEQVADADPRFLRWATRALLKWRPSPEIASLKIYQIHGSADRLLPANRSQSDHFIDRAGHLLTLSHPNEVNEFLRRHMPVE